MNTTRTIHDIVLARATAKTPKEVNDAKVEHALYVLTSGHKYSDETLATARYIVMQRMDGKI